MALLNFLMLYLVLAVIPLSLCGLSTKHFLLHSHYMLGVITNVVHFFNIFLLPLSVNQKWNLA